MSLNIFTMTVDSVRTLFKYYRSLGQKTIDQVPDEGLFWQCNGESNSIAILVKHLNGNMLSRWTNFLTEDGEKPWRDRDGEFLPTLTSRKQVQHAYDEGWDCLFAALDQCEGENLTRIVYIRNMGHTIIDAIHRQIGHYAYHIGQIVFIGKCVQNEKWNTLSIARNASVAYNEEKFAKEKATKHFTEDL